MLWYVGCRLSDPRVSELMGQASSYESLPVPITACADCFVPQLQTALDISDAVAVFVNGSLDVIGPGRGA